MGKISGKYCRGQAMTELMACLIGICFVVLGMLFVSIVGSKGVRSMLEARKDAESNIVNDTGFSSAKSILVWYNISPGQGDGLYFTADDSSIPGSSGNSSLYRSELVSNDHTIHIPSLAAKYKSPNYVPFSALESNMLFLKAADLREGESSLSEPLGDPHSRDLKRAMERFGMGTKVCIQDKLYLPNIKDEK